MDRRAALQLFWPVFVVALRSRAASTHSKSAGAGAFEIVARYCYGLDIELTVENIAPVYCASRVLQVKELEKWVRQLATIRGCELSLGDVAAIMHVPRTVQALASCPTDALAVVN